MPSSTPPAGANFYLPDSGRSLAPSWRERAVDNIAAIRLARRIESEERAATPAEQAVLVRFTSFGAGELANNLFPVKGRAVPAAWHPLIHDLESSVSRGEKSALMRSTQYAHYTPEYLVHSLWNGVRRLGWRGGRALEAGCGTGLFLATTPPELRDATRFVGIENCPVTHRIARLLHPNATILCEDFTDDEFRLGGGFSLAIGNPPFSDRTAGKGFDCGNLSLHDFFLWRSIEALAPGGIGAFVVSRYTMDKGSEDARRKIDDLADLVGAIRMPAASMRREAGTDVVVDLLFFRRRASSSLPSADAQPWIELSDVQGENATAIMVNRYFKEHPCQVLGRHAVVSSQYGPTYSCLPAPGLVLKAVLSDGILRLPECEAIDPATFASPEAQRAMPDIKVGTAADGATIKEGSFLVGDDDRIYQIEDGHPVLADVGGLNKQRLVRAFILIRDALRKVLRAQEANEPFEEAQKRLTFAYTQFVRAYGPINRTTIVTRTDPKTNQETESLRRPNLAPVLDDPDCWLVAACEEYDADNNTARPGAVFTKRVISAPPNPQIVTAADALAVVLNELGRIDVPRIAALLGRTEAEALSELGTTLYMDPQTREWMLADQYLSGPVRSKLRTAQKAAARDPKFERNVEALARVRLPDLKPSEITARLGSPAIPTEAVVMFISQVMRIKTSVIHNKEFATWTVDQKPFAGAAAATSEWGTKRRHSGKLLMDALNAHIPKIYDELVDYDGNKTTVLNTVETEAAKEKLEKIHEAFEAWVWNNPGRAERLVQIYSEIFCNLVARHFDGDHLILPGASNVITLRKHQKRVVWRIIATGSTYIVHPVGAGKTTEIAAAAMEQRRLGLVDKPMIVVPGHCLAQFAREFLQLYPSARILVADEVNFTKPKRSRFLARAAMGNWDAIIITHSAFKLIPCPADFEREMVEQELERYRAGLEAVSGEDRITRKRIEKAVETLKAQLKALKSRKDDMITLAEMGVDQIIVDESHEYKRLGFRTNMSTIRGVDSGASEMAWDLYVKSRLTETKRPGRGLILSSGTPISNTMGEMFTIQRYLQPELLHERGLHEFDAWAATFGRLKTELELQPSGLYKPATRFAGFVNIADLMSMFRMNADVVSREELRDLVKLPSIKGGRRQIISALPSEAFREEQAKLARTMKMIEGRRGRPKPGEPIILTVLGDGRHLAIDARFCNRLHQNDAANKLNMLIANVFRIWKETSQDVYINPSTDRPYELRGASQMIFSDLGTLAVEPVRGFSAYRWIRTELIRMGVPPQEIAFIQSCKKLQDKARFVSDLNAGRIRVAIGSSQMMGTGVNGQYRLKALHHLDVPFLPKDIEQREGRIERQGNQNPEIEIVANVTAGSMDAAMWQMNQRKAGYIEAALCGDRSVRTIENNEMSPSEQFAYAKAIASGDDRLMLLAGLQRDVARLRRRKWAHSDDQIAVKSTIAQARGAIEDATDRIADVKADLKKRHSVEGDAFTMTVGKRAIVDRKSAGAQLLTRMRELKEQEVDSDVIVGSIGGFQLMVNWMGADLWLMRTHKPQHIRLDAEQSNAGVVQKLEHALKDIDNDIDFYKQKAKEARATIKDYEPRLTEVFEDEDELKVKSAALKELESALAATGKEDAAPDPAPDAEALAA